MKKYFIDCGANEGQSLTRFTEKWADWKDYTIACFEPDPRAYPILLKKAERLQSTNIMCYEAAVWIEEGTIDLYQSREGNFGSSLLADKKTGSMSKDPIKVECIDLSNFILSTCIGSAEVILKMDIEGAEYFVLDHLISTQAINLITTLYIEFHGEKVGRADQDIQDMLIKLSKFSHLKVNHTSWHQLNFI